MVWMSIELIGSMDVIWQDLFLEVAKLTANFDQASTTNLTQHDSHGPDDGSKTIDYHHLDMSRDDGMDEHGNDWLYGCHLAGFGLGSFQQIPILIRPRPQI
jgi:hypothetical protein